MSTIMLRTRADSDTGYRSTRAIAELDDGPFDVRELLARAATAKVAREGWRRPPNLADIDLDDLREQLVASGRGDCLSFDGRLDLRGVDFDGWLMPGIKATRVDLSGARLSRTVLDGAMLDCARMSGANMDGASLQEASLRRADLSDVSMATAKIGSALRPLAFVDSGYAAKSEYTVNARSAHLEGARMSRAHLEGVDLSNSHLDRADLVGANIRDCNFSEATLTGTDFSNSRMLRNILRAPTAHLSKTQGARMWSNTYMPKLSVADFFGLQGYNRFSATLDREGESLSMMPREMKHDYLRSVVVTAAISVGTSMAAAHLMDSSAMGATLGALGGLTFARYCTVHALTHEVIHQAIEHALEYAGDAADSVRTFGRWLGSKVGMVSDAASGRAARRALVNLGLEDNAISFDACEGVTLMLSATRDLDEVLSMAGITPTGFVDARKKSSVKRLIGGVLPEELAPTKVTLLADGTSDAAWHDADGRLLKGARYDSDGNLVGVWNSATREFDQPGEDTDPLLARRHAPFAELRDAIVRSCVPHDGVTHLAALNPDGSIVIKSKSTGRVDNAPGLAAVRSPQGVLVEFSDGRRLGRLPSVPSEVADHAGHEQVAEPRKTG